MTVACPICGNAIDPKITPVHRCASSSALPPPTPNELTVSAPPAPLRRVVVIGSGVFMLVVLLGAIVFLRGGEPPQQVAAPSTTEEEETEDTTQESVAVTVAVAITVAPTAPAAVVETAAPTTVVAVDNGLQAVASTDCIGTTDTGFVPTAFMKVFTDNVTITSCRFAGRWFLAVWTNTSGNQEAGLFNIDQPVADGLLLPQLMSTPAGCIADWVNDPAVIPALTEGFPFAACEQ